MSEVKIDLNNLDKSNWKTYRFDEIAKNISERVDPNNTDLKVYIGLEHIDSESLHIKRHGTPDDVNGTKLKFYKGDIIFGRRRAYQRKAGIATWDGFCSAHALVLRANPDVIDPELFPFFLHSDLFMNRAIDISVGSLSPTINWGTLKHQEFKLPPKEMHLALAKLFFEANSALNQSHIVEENTSVLRKSYLRRFHVKSDSCKRLKIKDLMNFLYGKPLKESERIEGEFPVVSSAGIQGTHKEYLVDGPGIVVGRKGNVGEVTWVDKCFWPIDTAYYIEIKPQYKHIPLKFMYYLLESTDFNRFSIATAVPGLNRDDALSVNVYLPSDKDIEMVLHQIELIDNQIKLAIESSANLKVTIASLINKVF